MTTIKMDYVARVEGEASLSLEVEQNELKSLTLDIYEPPRFFQGFLVGRKYDEVPDIVARICGICPAAHEITAIQALEDAMGIQVSPQVRDLRRLLALAQDIQSHALHIYMLALPDYL
ncbi:MAG: nickel-dependent hydrogenase large subunit, partial [Mycobacterium leprae]